MTDTFDIEDRWPKLFEQLTDLQRQAVREALVENWHEGWTPTYDDVRDLADATRGAISQNEYLRRTLEAAKKRLPVAALG